MQVVVPFSYEELYVGNKTALITKRFQEFFYERDLFAFESPLKKDIYFFGRREYVHELISRHNSAENSGVFGCVGVEKLLFCRQLKEQQNIRI